MPLASTPSSAQISRYLTPPMTRVWTRSVRSGVDLNGHIRCFELELLCVNQVRRAERRVGAEVLVKLDVEFCKLRFLHAAAGEHLGNLLPAHDKRLVRF